MFQIIRGTAIALLATTVAILPLSIQQYDTANDIPTSMITSNVILRGRVIKVIDGDTIRIQHIPLLLDNYPFISNWKNRLSFNNRNQKNKCSTSTSNSSSKKINLSQCTISVRLYGIDAPEMAKAGNPGQPYAIEAKEYITNKVMSSSSSNGNSKKNHIVHVKLLGKDQYSRIIGRVTATIPKRNIFGITTGGREEDLSIGLAENGLASLYTGGGAKYDGHRSILENKINIAQQKKLGIWKNKSQFVDPAKYKKEMKYARR
jgi:endonuclease YncB( thermonuclease family)